MSQVNDYLIPGSPLTMAQLQVVSQNISAALGSNNLGSSAPANPFDGMNWIDTSGAPVWSVKVYSDGNGWREMATINVATGALGLPGFVKQTSPTDTSADVVGPGAFGLGGAGAAPTATLEDSNPQGLYTYFSSDPDAPSAVSGSLMSLRNATTGATNRQIAFEHNGDLIFTRRVNGSGLDWGDWSEIKTEKSKGWTLVEPPRTITTGVSAIAFTLPTDFEQFRFTFTNVTRSSNIDLQCRFSYNDGVSYPDSSTFYRYGLVFTGPAGGSLTAGQIVLTNTFQGLDAGQSLAAQFTLFPGSTGSHTRIFGNYGGRSGAGGTVGQDLAGAVTGSYTATGRATNIRFFTPFGDIGTARIILEGARF